MELDQTSTQPHVSNEGRKSTPKRSLLPISILLVATTIIAISLSPTIESEADAAGNQPIAATIHVDTNGDARYGDPRLFGTNLPAWLGRSRMADSDYQDLASYSGVSLMRLPGGSWSNAYEWLACEKSESGCPWPTHWITRPSDFITFLRATGQQAMYTVNQNGTSKEAAALVAFFTGSVNDETVIGVDVRGRDWGKVKT